MFLSWRVIFLVCMLALGVTGIGATAHFGMTMHSAAASVTVTSGDASATDMCLLHCLVARDIPVGDGMLAMSAVVLAMAAAVIVACVAHRAGKVLVPRACFARYGDPGLLLTICKRE